MLTSNTSNMSYFDYKTTIESDSPVIRAAFRLAERAHAGQPRGKVDPNIPYIIHPIMVFELLHYHGIRNELTLAAALLHDAKEDGDRYNKKPLSSTLFADDLQAELQQEGVIDAKEIALEIDSLCRELTNARVMRGGKRAWQVRHAERLSPRAALLKITDQMASVLDSILLEDGLFDSKKKIDWNYKALDVVKNAANDRESLQYWKALFKKLFSYSMKMERTEEPDVADNLRRSFDFDALCEAAETEVPYTQAEHLIANGTKDIQNAALDSLQQGITHIYVNDNGTVEGYENLVKPTADRYEDRNRCSVTLMGELEASNDNRRVSTNSLYVRNGRLVQAHKIKPEIGVDEFCAIAKQCGAMDRAFEMQIGKEIRNGRAGGMG